MKEDVLNVTQCFFSLAKKSLTGEVVVMPPAGYTQNINATECGKLIKDIPGLIGIQTAGCHNQAEKCLFSNTSMC